MYRWGFVLRPRLSDAPSAVARALLVLALLPAGGCAARQEVPEDLALGEERPSPNEPELEARGLALIRRNLERDWPAGERALRAAQAKGHGCVRGQFHVANELPPSLAAGLFARRAVYPAWVRFSNGIAKPQPDTEDDIRSVAVKVMGVPGEKLSPDERGTQDFLMINYPTLPAGTPEEFVGFGEAFAENRPFGYFLGWNPFAWKIGALLEFGKAVGQEVPSLLAIRYWTAVPFRHGSVAVKYSMWPCAKVDAAMPDNPGPAYLRDDLKARLAADDACFLLATQPQVDPVEMPIEDAAVEWSEERSPFVPVATLHIPAQTFDTPAQERFCDNLAFTPWHALPDHRPLGGLNRVRRALYAASTAWRHAHNGEASVEPTGDERF